MDQWPRQISISIAHYFKEAASDLSDLAVLIEHLDERTPQFMASSDTLEVRITGPYIKPLPGGEYRVRATVNLLFTSRFDGVAKNSYKILDSVGTMIEAMKGPITLWNFNDGYTEDIVDIHGNIITDNSATRISLGCLSIVPGQSIMVDNYGGIDTTDKIKVSEAEVKYETILTDEY